MAPLSWQADLVSFFRMHLLFVGLGALVLAFLVRGIGPKLAGAMAFASALVPFLWTPATALPAQVDTASRFRIVSANIYVDNPDPTSFVGFLRRANPDLVVLQETTGRWQDAISAVSVWPYQSSIDMQSRDDMKVFSRFPILSERIVSPESRDTGGRHPVRFELAVGSSRVVLFAVHAQTPRTKEMWRERNAYLRDITAAVQAEAQGTKIIVTGDWNTPIWSPFFSRVLTDANLRTAQFEWWPAPTRFSLRFGSISELGIPIDHIAVSPNIGLAGFSTGPQFGSNHLPISADLTLPTR
jgi:endonuclease/exonuclease/phosphatase (EEP) superfamily protein YafD